MFLFDDKIRSSENAPDGVLHDSGENDKRARHDKRVRSNRRAQKKTAKRMRRSSRTAPRKILITAAAILAGVLVAAAGILGYKYIRGILHPSIKLFSTPRPIASLSPCETTAVPTADPSANPIDVLNLREQLDAQADKTIITDGILNIMLIGVDYADERVSPEWTGKTAFHADVMMVLAVNFGKNTVDLISLPRDTYAKIPDVKGIYKLNASLDCGGGMVPSGYEKVCEAAEWMLGGIPVDYYYAVTMPVVKRLGDVVGGVEFDLESDFTIGGRHYSKGMQHLDGQGILDYLRVRKDISEYGDWNRVNRQKRMLVALFDQMKRSNKLLLIPEIISAFGDDIATNTTLQQTMALALWALDLSADSIKMYSMGGVQTSIFGWNFCLTDQENRIKIIQEVYGAEVEPYLTYTKEYALFYWHELLYEQALKTTEGMTEEIKALLGAYYPSVTPFPILSPEPTAEPPLPSGQPPLPTPIPMPSPSSSFRTAYAPSPTPAPGLPTRMPYYTNTQYTAFEWMRIKTAELLGAYNEAVDQANLFLNKEPNTLDESVQKLTEACAGYQAAFENANAVFGLERTFEWTVEYWLDPEFNEITVDFR